jgi:hypothetical protein
MAHTNRVTITWKVEVEKSVVVEMTDEQIARDENHDLSDELRGLTSNDEINRVLAEHVGTQTLSYIDESRSAVKQSSIHVERIDFDEIDNSEAISMQERAWDTYAYGN